MTEKINQILREYSHDVNKARSEIKKITRQNFQIFESDGSLFVEFDDPTDNVGFDGFTLLTE
jgi:hypothetical protein